MLKYKPSMIPAAADTCRWKLSSWPHGRQLWNIIPDTKWRILHSAQETWLPERSSVAKFTLQARLSVLLPWICHKPVAPVDINMQSIIIQKNFRTTLPEPNQSTSFVHVSLALCLEIALLSSLRKSVYRLLWIIGVEGTVWEAWKFLASTCMSYSWRGLLGSFFFFFVVIHTTTTNNNEFKF